MPSGKRYYRFSLRTFLLAACTGAVLCGIGTRWWLGLPVKFVLQTQGVDGYAVTACWSEDRMQRATLKYLVVFPEGDIATGGEGNGESRTLRAPPPGERARLVIQDNQRRVTSKPVPQFYTSGIYVDGELLPHSADGKLWIYRTTLQEIHELPPGPLPKLPFSRQLFNQLAETEWWKKVLKPAAEIESDAFMKMVISQ